MNYYFVDSRRSGMGPVTRGICILKEMGGGTLICPSVFHWAAKQEGLTVREVGTWLDLPRGNNAIFDLRPTASVSQVARLRSRKFLVLREEPQKARIYMPFMDEVFSVGQEIAGAVSVNAIIPDIDEQRAIRWWGKVSPRILLVQAGSSPDETLALSEIARKAGLSVKVCSPWTPESRYWPATELMATADLVISGGGNQTRTECKQLGVQLLSYSFGRDDQSSDIKLTSASLIDHVQNRLPQEKTRPQSGAATIASRIG